MRLCQTYVHLHDKVLPVPFEECMCLLVKDDDDVSRFQPWLLVALPREGHLLPVLHPLVHRHLQDLPLTIHFPPVALLTPELGVVSLPLRGTRRTSTGSVASYQAQAAGFAPACRSPCSWDTFGQLQVFPRSPHSRRR